jgi:hypothetical protein
MGLTQRRKENKNQPNRFFPFAGFAALRAKI